MAHTAPPSCLSVRTTYASSLFGSVTETTTVEITQMRSFTSAVRSPAHKKKKKNCSALIFICCICREVFLRPALSAHPQWKSSVRHLSVSAVTTTAASTATSCATLSMTVVTAQMRDRKTVSVIISSGHIYLLALSRLYFCV